MKNVIIVVIGLVVSTLMTVLASSTQESKLMGVIYDYNGSVYDNLIIETEAEFTGEGVKLIVVTAITGGRKCDMTIRQSLDTNEVLQLTKENCKHIDE